MQIDINMVLNAYKEEISKLTNEVILLKAQIMQLQNDLEKQQEEQE